MPRKRLDPAAEGKVVKGYDSLGRPIWHTPVDALTKLMRRITRLDSGCWEWSGGCSDRGYGQTSVSGKRVYTHRLSYELHIGPIPDGLELDHLCHSRDNSCPGGNACRHRRCANPWHLEPVTGRENMRRSTPARRTHCPAGHLYDEQNTRRRASKGGNRECRTCNRERAQRMAAERTHCRRGHELTPDNLIVRKDGARCCRICREALGASERGGLNRVAKLTEDDVRSIRARAAAGESQASLARAFDVSQQGVSHIIRRTTWRHVS